CAFCRRDVSNSTRPTTTKSATTEHLRYPLGHDHLVDRMNFAAALSGERLHRMVVFELREDGSTAYLNMTLRSLYNSVVRAITDNCRDANRMQMQQGRDQQSEAIDSHRTVKSIQSASDDDGRIDRQPLQQQREGKPQNSLQRPARPLRSVTSPIARSSSIGGGGGVNRTTYRDRLGGYLHPRDMRRLVTPFSSSNEPQLIVPAEHDMPPVMKENKSNERLPDSLTEGEDYSDHYCEDTENDEWHDIKSWIGRNCPSSYNPVDAILQTVTSMLMDDVKKVYRRAESAMGELRGDYPNKKRSGALTEYAQERLRLHKDEVNLMERRVKGFVEQSIRFSTRMRT
ncbi:hypothetical protein ACHAW5_007692, partial [Stephanodiscus triporus]